METIILSLFGGILVGLMLSQLVNDIRRFFYTFASGAVILIGIGLAIVRCPGEDLGSVLLALFFIFIFLYWLSELGQFFTKEQEPEEAVNAPETYTEVTQL